MIELLEKKLAILESKNDLLQSERDELDRLLKEVGFNDGLNSLKMIVQVDLDSSDA